ncbi:hypothetical protein DMENIID0001_135660 [Sergentomyia squamirostris]
MEPAEKKIKLEELQESPEKSILDLNDDCLIQIFSYFSLEKLVEVDKVCPRFRSVAEEYFYKKQKVLKIEKTFQNRTPVADLAERMGPYVSTLEINTYCTNLDYLKPLWIHCTSLEHLTIRYTKIMTHVELMKDIFKNLKSAILVYCGLSDEIGEYLKTAPDLYNLSLKANPEITGNFLPELKHQLKEINVIKCDNIFRTPYFGEFCRDNLKLESLAIRLPYYRTLMASLAELTNLTKLILVNPQLIPASNIVPHFPKLTHLELRAAIFFTSEVNIILYRFLEYLGNMDCLEYLRIDENVMSSTESITKVYNRILPKFTKLKVLKVIHKYTAEFADSHLEGMKCRQTIESLEICNSRKITDKGLFKFLKDCPNIKNLYLKRCRKITDNLIHKLMPVCAERPHTLEILADETKITDYIKDELQELQEEDRKIEFHCDSTFRDWCDSDDSDSSHDSYEFDTSYDSDMD